MILDRTQLLDHPSFRSCEVRVRMAEVGFPHGCLVYRLEDIRSHNNGTLKKRLRPSTVYGFDEITQALGEPCDIKNLYTFIFEPGWTRGENSFKAQYVTTCSATKHWITERQCIEERLIDGVIEVNMHDPTTPTN